MERSSAQRVLLRDSASQRDDGLVCVHSQHELERSVAATHTDIEGAHRSATSRVLLCDGDGFLVDGKRERKKWGGEPAATERQIVARPDSSRMNALFPALQQIKRFSESSAS